MIDRRQDLDTRKRVDLISYELIRAVRRLTRVTQAQWVFIILFAFAIGFLVNANRDRGRVQRATVVRLVEQSNRQRDLIRQLAFVLDQIQRSRLEASEDVCLANGSTNLALLTLLSLSRRSTRNVSATPEQRQVLQSVVKDLHKPGAVRPPAKARAACRAYAKKRVKPRAPVLNPKPAP